jgi:hypothetical protein
MTALTATVRFDRGLSARAADLLVVAVAFVLPWSTSATGICIALWLIAVLPTLDVPSVRRELATPAGAFPVALCALAVIGVLWADVGWSEYFEGLESFLKLLVIPVLLVQFRRSEKGMLILWVFLFSCGLLLFLSFILVLTPGLTWRGKVLGVPVHDDIFQDTAFIVCGFALFGAACDRFRERQRTKAAGLIVIGAFFFLDFAFAVFSRIALMVAPALALILGWRVLRWEGIIAAIVLLSTVAVAGWFGSSNIRGRLDHSLQEIEAYRSNNEATSIGEHSAFVLEALAIFRSATIIGHGTGSIPEQFRRVTFGQTGVSAEASVNPHNQTLAVAIQLGVIGAAVLWAMWISHLMLFRGTGTTAWIGTVLVVQNILSSVAHSHLFDFNNGWLYVFGVGVVGGMVLRERETINWPRLPSDQTFAPEARPVQFAE